MYNFVLELESQKTLFLPATTTTHIDLFKVAPSTSREQSFNQIQSALDGPLFGSKPVD